MLVKHSHPPLPPATMKRSSEDRVLHSLLREIRTQANLRQEDLAGRLGVGQSYVSKYESGERRLDVLELRSICIACGIPTRDFVDRLEAALSSQNV